MKKSEKIGIVIVVILAVVFVVSIFNVIINGEKRRDLNNACDLICYLKGQDYWTFPGADADSYYYTKEECVVACKIARGIK